MSAQIIHPPTESFPFPDTATSSSFASLPTVALTPGFFSLPSLANEPWPPSNCPPTPPALPSWAVKPDPDQQQLCIDPALQPDHHYHQQKQSQRSQRSRKSSTPSSSSDIPTTNNTKREQFLARNRLAASKCRQKKRKHNKELESQYEAVAQRKKQLQTEADHLRSQVLQLKDELLRHSQCNDDSIKGHLAKMVNQVTRKSSTFIDVNSLLTTDAEGSSEVRGGSSGDGSSADTPHTTPPTVVGGAGITADSPLLQEVLERERRQSGRWAFPISYTGSGPGHRTEVDFDDLINFG
ncbi:bZIP transcription factor [Aspergillus melleus]|uniref:bZIP transcription factor n=1 Tax=Aspergillus melleus TaxID=138277 RepID=UPI001E8E84E7|nr:uncharacterized protein LDX57_008640 [Aspergillus melleus]KAH8430978.1 hypothetical protein LDX57_008640 [Aspergillus melleus]